MSETDPRGVLLVGHGTRNEAGTAEFFVLAKLIAELIAPVPLEPCFLELRPPTMSDGWQSLVRRGVRQIRVAPALLWAAGHALRDLPNTARELAAATQGELNGLIIKHDQAPVLANHPLVLQRSAELELATLARLPQGDLATTALVLVGRGSTDDQATQDMIQFAEQRAATSPTGRVEVAFVAMALPTLGTLLDELGRDRGIRDIVVQPHLLFSGELQCTICKMVRRAAERYPNKRWVVTDLLGPHPHVAAAIVQRCELGGDIANQAGASLKSPALRYATPHSKP